MPEQQAAGCCQSDNRHLDENTPTCGANISRDKLDWLSPRVEWDEVKASLGGYCPAGAEEFSPGFQPGFNPGKHPIKRFALKGRVKCKMRKTKSAVTNGETREEGVKSYPCGSAPVWKTLAKVLGRCQSGCSQCAAAMRPNDGPHWRRVPHSMCKTSYVRLPHIRQTDKTMASSGTIEPISA